MSFAFVNRLPPKSSFPSSDWHMSQWRKPPPVIILSGSDEALRIRELKEAVSVADQMGRKIQYIEGSEHQELEALLSSTGVFFQEQMLVIVENPSTAPVDLVVHHYERDENDVVLVRPYGSDLI